MPDFLKRLLLLIAANLAGFRALSLNMHSLRALAIILVILAIGNIAIWKWEFE